MRVATPDEFTRTLAEGRTWRIKEISDLKTLAERSKGQPEQAVLLRSIVAMCYAHWEGYVKFAALAYFKHVTLKKLPLSKLKPQFSVNYFLPRINALAHQRASLAENSELVFGIISSPSAQFKRLHEDLVSTKSNLNSEVYSDICFICDINAPLSDADKIFVDVILLRRRNSIAHGEDTLIGPGELTSITASTIELIRRFGEALENSVHLGAFRQEEPA